MNPLAELNDIALPNAIHSYPVAPGWWILLFLLCATSLFVFYRVRKYYAHRKYKRLALAQLEQENISDETIIAILKWAALHYFPRADVASLFGEQFQQFLSNSLAEQQQSSFNELSQECFNGLYKKPQFGLPEQEQDENSLKQAAVFWLNHALMINKPAKAGAQK